MNGKLIVISGFSGSGKGTIVSNIMNTLKNASLSISCATRDKRNGEKEGVHYFFKTKDEFKDMIKNDKLLEYAEYAGNFYGTPKDYVIDKLNSGKNVILEIDEQGGFQIKNKYKDAILIFVTTDSFGTLLDRLKNRGTETIESLKKRFNMALKEADNAIKYDYIIVNDTIENASKKIIDIIDGKIENNSNKKNNLQIINKIKEDIRGYLNV